MFKQENSLETDNTNAIDSTGSSSAKTLLRNKDLLNTALNKIISHSERKNIDLYLFEAVLGQLAILDPRQSQIVELKFFRHVSTEEIARMLRLPTAKVIIEWQIAKMWIYNELKKKKLS